MLRTTQSKARRDRRIQGDGPVVIWVSEGQQRSRAARCLHPFSCALRRMNAPKLSVSEGKSFSRQTLTRVAMASTSFCLSAESREPTLKATFRCTPRRLYPPPSFEHLLSTHEKNQGLTYSLVAYQGRARGVHGWRGLRKAALTVARNISRYAGFRHYGKVLTQVYPDPRNVDDELVESIRVPSLDPNAPEVILLQPFPTVCMGTPCTSTWCSPSGYLASNDAKEKETCHRVRPFLSHFSVFFVFVEQRQVRQQSVPDPILCNSPCRRH